jgi:hypothetical protein
VITARCFNVELDMTDGSTVTAPAGYALLYGSPIPSGTALWMPYDRTPVDVQPSKDAVQYIGPGAYVTKGVELPPLNLKAWTLVGEVSEVWYRRRGTYEGEWHHPFGEKKRLLVFSRKKPLLYQCGTIRRLELRGASWGWRGFDG